MKKLIIALLCVIMLFSFASCTKGGNVDDQSSNGDAMSTIESTMSSVKDDMTSDQSNNDTSSANS